MAEPTKKEKTCEERIDAELKKTISYMREMWDVYTGEKEPTDEITEESFHEYGLSFDYVEPAEPGENGYFRYQLSWGGPSDEFRFYCDPGFRCYYVEYVFMDWFDGAQRKLRNADERFLLEIFEDCFKDSGTAEHVFKEATEG